MQKCQNLSSMRLHQVIPYQLQDPRMIEGTRKRYDEHWGGKGRGRQRRTQRQDRRFSTRLFLNSSRSSIPRAPLYHLHDPGGAVPGTHCLQNVHQGPLSKCSNFIVFDLNLTVHIFYCLLCPCNHYFFCYHHHHLHLHIIKSSSKVVHRH